MEELGNLMHWAERHVETWVFYVLSLLAIPLAYGVIFDKAIIRSGFILIGVFGVISGLFLLLQAQFLAMAQIMIYAVGITLVVVIALMLTNPRQEADANPGIQLHKLPAIVVAVLMFITIHMASRSEPWNLSTATVHPANVHIIGLSLMTWYAMPFEVASVLLLAAMIGAVMLAKSEVRGEAEETAEAGESSQEAERAEDVVKV